MANLKPLILFGNLHHLKAKEKQKAIAEFKAAKTLEQLIELGKQRGYKPGWAYKMDAERKEWKEKNGNRLN